MKKFIIQTLIFVALAVVGICGVIGSTYFIMQQASFVLPPHKHILALGDSHVKNSIDDNIYTQCTNVGQDATAYLYLYCMLKKIINDNKHIDTVLLTLHSGNISGEERIFDEILMSDKIPGHFSLLSKEELYIWWRHKSMALMSAVIHSPVENIRAIIGYLMHRKKFSYRDLYIGGYMEIDRKKLQESIEWYKKTADTVAVLNTDTTTYDREYLLKIVELCKSKNITLILINTPTYKPEIYGELDKVNAYYRAYLQGVKYLDYSAFPLADSCYSDIGHLNYKGARIFSTYLQENFTKDVSAAMQKVDAE
jgi:hypothetical protein